MFHRRLWHVHNNKKNIYECHFPLANWCWSPTFKKACEQRQFACEKCESTHISRNFNQVMMTNHAYDSILSHAHNVLQKVGLCEHGICVKMNVHILNKHVVRENIVFWISQNTLSRTLSKHFWMFRKKGFLENFWDHQFQLSSDVFLTVTNKKQSPICL